MIEFTDRYQALGIPYPTPETVCLGHCEGTGFVPVRYDEQDSELRRLWAVEHARHGDTLRDKLAILVRTGNARPLFEQCDGCHFVKCPECGGTGKRPKEESDHDR